MTYPKVDSPQGHDPCFLVVHENRLLCTEAGDLYFASARELEAWRPALASEPLLLSKIAGHPHWLAPVSEPLEVPGGQWLGLRAQLGHLEDPVFGVAGQAVQLARWQREHRFCGRCGGPTQDVPGERAKYCPACDLRFYPRLSPCMISLVTRQDHCLLALHARSKRPVYTALAGFVEVGEGVEDTVHREIYEEVGLDVGPLEYFGSQAWPFPGQLMLGFHAQYAGGEIQVDGTEIVAADWWRYDQLPEVPPPETLSGQLIAHFVAEQHNKNR